MRCLFCKDSSDGSRSVEHVIPESLGNHTLLLPAGVVCDKCNNYFGRKVEAPFLKSPAIRLLRHNQVVQSKRGRVPTVRAIAPGHGLATMHAPTNTTPRLITFDDASQATRWLTSANRESLLTEDVVEPPSRQSTSRLLAKVALEFIATRLEGTPGGLEYLIGEPYFDPLRDHARRGSTPDWPVSVRRIYSPNARWREGSGHVQKVWEAEVLEDDSGAQYVIVAIFGIEFAIHLGGPDISGYRRWLVLSGGRSPLYQGRYASQLENRAGSFDRRHQAIILAAS